MPKKIKNEKLHFNKYEITYKQINNLIKTKEFLEKLNININVDENGKIKLGDILKYSVPIQYFILLVTRGSLFLEGDFYKLSDLETIDRFSFNGGEYLQHISIYENFIKNRESIKDFDKLAELDMPAHSYYKNCYDRDLKNNHFATVDNTNDNLDDFADNFLD